jgi:hypothetical protein
MALVAGKSCFLDLDLIEEDEDEDGPGLLG